MSTLLEMNTSYISIADGKFDTRYRYLRAGSSGSNFPMPKGATFKVQHETSGGVHPNWRWSDGVGSYSYNGGGSSVSYDPAYTLVFVT
jgi:hypothetical protein